MANGMAAPNVQAVRDWCVNNNKKVPTCIATITQEEAATVFAGKRKDERGRENPVYTTLVRLNSQMGNGVKGNPAARTSTSPVASLPTIAEIDVQIAKLRTLREALVAMAAINAPTEEDIVTEAIDEECDEDEITPELLAQLADEDRLIAEKNAEEHDTAEIEAWDIYAAEQLTVGE